MRIGGSNPIELERHLELDLVPERNSVPTKSRDPRFQSAGEFEGTSMDRGEHEARLLRAGLRSL